MALVLQQRLPLPPAHASCGPHLAEEREEWVDDRPRVGEAHPIPCQGCSEAPGLIRRPHACSLSSMHIGAVEGWGSLKLKRGLKVGDSPAVETPTSARGSTKAAAGPGTRIG